MEKHSSKPVIHPYSAIGGGKEGTVHDPKVVVERHAFLVALPEEHRRYAKIGEHNVFYARVWGGELRERRLDEESPKEEEQLIRLLFVQGLGGTHANWFHQIEFFAKDPRFDIVALDCRGVGHSDTPSGRWKTSDIAQDVIALLDHELKWAQCHLFGFSLGGMVSLEAALHRPDLFKSVNLISTHAGGLLGTLLPPWGIQPFLRTFGDLGSVSALDRGMELLHSSDYLDAEVHHVDEGLGKVAAEVLGTNDRVTNRFKTALELIQQGRKYVEAGSGPEIRLEGTLRQISAAITHHVGWDRLYYLKVSGISFLVLAGMQDNLVNYMNAGMLAEALNAPLIMKEDAGHGVNLHYRDEVNQALLTQIETAERKKPVEGRRPLSAKSGFPPGTHPWKTAFLSFFPVYMIARKVASSSQRRLLLIVAAISLILRLVHGPVYRIRH